MPLAGVSADSLIGLLMWPIVTPALGLWISVKVFAAVWYKLIT